MDRVHGDGEFDSFAALFAAGEVVVAEEDELFVLEVGEELVDVGVLAGEAVADEFFVHVEELVDGFAAEDDFGVGVDGSVDGDEEHLLVFAEFLDRFDVF